MEGELVYYEAAAQVIPVLLLVLAFEERVFRDPVFLRTPLDRVLGAGVVLVAVVAEIATLWVLYEGDARRWQSELVGAAIILLLALVFIWTIPLKRHAPKDEDAD